MMNVLMINFSPSRNIWGEVILTTNKILNRAPPRETQWIPYELWKLKKLKLKYFKVCGCLAKVEVPLTNRVKIWPIIVNCVFIVYDVNKKTCHFLVHKYGNLENHVNMVIESDNAQIFKHIYLYKTVSTKNTQPNKDPRRSNSQSKSTSFGLDFIAFCLKMSLKHLKELWFCLGQFIGQKQSIVRTNQF